MTEKTVKEVEVKPVAKLEEEGDIAADYLEALLDIEISSAEYLKLNFLVIVIK